MLLLVPAVMTLTARPGGGVVGGAVGLEARKTRGANGARAGSREEHRTTRARDTLTPSSAGKAGRGPRAGGGSKTPAAKPGGPGRGTGSATVAPRVDHRGASTHRAAEGSSPSAHPFASSNRASNRQTTREDALDRPHAVYAPNGQCRSEAPPPGAHGAAHLKMWRGLERGGKDHPRLLIRIAGPMVNATALAEAGRDAPAAVVAHKGLFFPGGRVLRYPRPAREAGSGGSKEPSLGGEVPEEEPSMMTIDFPQAAVDMLPRADARWRFRSCAIVGNSGALLGSKYGSAIDAHDAVWRINYAPVHRWAEDVGTRTTFDLINQQHTKRFVMGETGSAGQTSPDDGDDGDGGEGGASYSRGKSVHAAPRDSILAVFEVTGNYARKHLYAGLMRRRGSLRGSGLGDPGAFRRSSDQRRTRRGRRLRRTDDESDGESEDEMDADAIEEAKGDRSIDVEDLSTNPGERFERREEEKEAKGRAAERAGDEDGGLARASDDDFREAALGGRGSAGDDAAMGGGAVTTPGTYTSGVAIFSPELVLHAQEVWSRLAPQVHAMHSGGGGGGASLGKAGKAMSGVYAVVLSAQVCEHVHMYGFSPYNRRTNAPYHYFDDTPAVLKHHSFDLAFEVFKSLSQWPCSGIKLTVHP